MPKDFPTIQAAIDVATSRDEGRLNDSDVEYIRRLNADPDTPDAGRPTKGGNIADMGCYECH